MGPKREVHIILHDTGHMPANQCWCEPHVEQTKDRDGTPITIFFHTDYSPHHHSLIMQKRSEHPGWISQFLDSLGTLNG